MSKKPHILFITTDELRKDALSCYGNRAAATPNIDKLAEQGIRFDEAYTASPRLSDDSSHAGTDVNFP